MFGFLTKFIHYRDEGGPIRQGLNIFIKRSFYDDCGTFGGSRGFVIRRGDWIFRWRYSLRTKKRHIRWYNMADELRGLSVDQPEEMLRVFDGDRPPVTPRGPRRNAPFWIRPE